MTPKNPNSQSKPRRGRSLCARRTDFVRKRLVNRTAGQSTVVPHDGPSRYTSGSLRLFVRSFDRPAGVRRVGACVRRSVVGTYVHIDRSIARTSISIGRTDPTDMHSRMPATAARPAVCRVGRSYVPAGRRPSVTNERNERTDARSDRRRTDRRRPRLANETSRRNERTDRQATETDRTRTSNEACRHARTHARRPAPTEDGQSVTRLYVERRSTDVYQFQMKPTVGHVGSFRRSFVR